MNPYDSGYNAKKGSNIGMWKPATNAADAKEDIRMGLLSIVLFYLITFIGVLGLSFAKEFAILILAASVFLIPACIFPLRAFGFYADAILKKLSVLDALESHSKLQVDILKKATTRQSTEKK